jgi:hypothetical protein
MGELAQDLVMLINRIFPPGTARQLSLSLGFRDKINIALEKNSISI